MCSDKVYSITELNNLAKSSLKEVSGKGIWVKGEIIGYKPAESGRYSSFLLCEKQEGSNDILAQVQVMCWGEDLEEVEQKLRTLDQSLRLKNGLVVQLKCSFDLWVKAGRYQIVARDIDPSVTLGEIYLLRAKIFNELKDLGLHEKNKRLAFPLCPIKIALISSRGCAGYNDFIEELFSSGYPFQIGFYHASVQGEAVEAGVTAAIDLINKEYSHYDVIAIVRGGGSELDLKWFDNKNIGVSIANSRIPVLTGIGHEINLSVADMVAHSFFKTPTAVASFLVNKVREYDNTLRDLIENIHEQAEEVIAETKADLFELIKNIVSEARPVLSGAKASFASLYSNILRGLPLYVKSKKSALAHLEEKLNFYDPRRTIKLGYSITRDKKGRVLKSLRQISKNDEIATNLSDGNILSIVAGKEELNGK